MTCLVGDSRTPLPLPCLRSHLQEQAEPSAAATSVDVAHYNWLKLELARKTISVEAAADKVAELLAENRQLQDRVQELEVSTGTLRWAIMPLVAGVSAEICCSRWSCSCD